MNTQQELQLEYTAACLRIAGNGVVIASIGRIAIAPFSRTGAMLLYAAGAAHIAGSVAIACIFDNKMEENSMRAMTAARTLGEASRAIFVITAVAVVCDVFSR